MLYVIEEDHGPAPAVAVQEIEHIHGSRRQCIRKEKVDMVSVVCGIDKGMGGFKSGGPLFVKQESARSRALNVLLINKQTTALDTFMCGPA